MSDFLDILTHGRRLQGAVKELSIEELEQVQEKLRHLVKIGVLIPQNEREIALSTFIIPKKDDTIR